MTCRGRASFPTLALAQARCAQRGGRRTLRPYFCDVCKAGYHLTSTAPRRAKKPRQR